MADLKALEQEIESLGKKFLGISESRGITHRTLKNNLAAKLLVYALSLHSIEYKETSLDDFEDSISDAICSCLQQTPDSWIAVFKVALKHCVAKTKNDETVKGLVNIKPSVKFAKDLIKLATWKGLVKNPASKRFDEETLRNLFECGRSLGKSDKYIKIALLNWSQSSFIAGDEEKGNEKQNGSDSHTTVFDSTSIEDFADFIRSSVADERLERILLYLKSLEEVYLSKKGSAEDNQVVFLSKWHSNLVIAALIKADISTIDIMEYSDILPSLLTSKKKTGSITVFDLLGYYEFIDKAILETFRNNDTWIPNTNRKSIGVQCGINESSIGNVDDRFRNTVMKRYNNMLIERGLSG